MSLGWELRGLYMLSYEDSLTFFAGEEPPVLTEGFWPPEQGFIWSKGNWCEIVFPFEKTKPTNRSDLILDLDAFKPEEAGQNVKIYLNGIRIGTKFVTSRMTFVVNFPTSILNAEDNVLTIDTPDAMTPLSVGIQDDRVLGIQLFSVQIRRC
jgi:hypothetical protein